MPGTRCAIFTCNNSLVKTKRENLDISYHKFPKDDIFKEAWMAACQRIDDWNPDTSVICSTHFTEQDFEVDLRRQLLNIKTKRRLKSTALPSLFLLRDEVQEDYSEPPIANSYLYQNAFNTYISIEEKPNNRSISGCSEIMMNDESQIKEEEPLKSECVYLVESTVNSYENELPILLSTEEQLQDPNISDFSQLNSTIKYKMLLEEKESLEMKYNELSDSCKEQKEKIGQLEKKLSQITKKYRRKHVNKQKMQVALNSIFSEAQQDKIVNKKRKIVWKSDDMLKAYHMMCLSRKCYIYIRNTLKYPLPHTDILVKWAEKLKRKGPVPLEDLKEEEFEDGMKKM